MPLKICEDTVLGKGGYGFVCKGELTLEVGGANCIAIGHTRLHVYIGCLCSTTV